MEKKRKMANVSIQFIYVAWLIRYCQRGKNKVTIPQSNRDAKSRKYCIIMSELKKWEKNEEIIASG